MKNKEINTLSLDQATMMLNAIPDHKHRCMFLIGTDAGLRVSEIISLKWGNFDFKKRLLIFRSLKKRKKSKDFQNRQIPLSDRLFFALSDYAFEVGKLDHDTYLFPSPKIKEKHICRFAVSKFIYRLAASLNIHDVSPHTLRHTCATNLVATGTDISTVADILGHQNSNTTRIYTHLPPEQLAKSINAAATRSGAKKKWLRNLVNYLFPKSPVIPYVPNQKHTPIVGRNAELQTISEHLEKGTNVIVFGHHGTGKRLLLDSVKTGKKILTFDDTASIKKSLIYMLLYLYQNDKEKVAAVLFGNFDLEKMETRLSRQSVGNLCDEIKKIVQPKEYVLKIKQFDDVTRQSLKVIESLKDTFVILAAANEISITKAPFFWNFEKLELRNLNKQKAIDLIHKLSYGMDIEDYEAYKTHILQQTDGNPKAITEMIERYRREPKLLTSTVRSVVFSGAVKEWDCSLVVVALIATLAVSRYMTGELDNPALRLIGGVAMILLIVTRTVVARTKRKYI